MLCVAVRALVAITETAKAAATASIRSAAGCMTPSPGLTIRRTPAKPSATQAARLGVSLSFRIGTASTATQTGMVNSRANTVASGRRVSASAQP